MSDDAEMTIEEMRRRFAELKRAEVDAQEAAREDPVARAAALPREALLEELDDLSERLSEARTPAARREIRQLVNTRLDALLLQREQEP